MPEEERRKLAPKADGNVTREVVITAIKRADSDRKQDVG
jgi:hypothetical protein